MPRQNRHFRKTMSAGFVAILLLFALMSWLTYRSTSQFGEQKTWLASAAVGSVGLLALGVCYLNVLRFATQCHQIEADLQLAKQGAEATTRTKSAFLANMSHEIRTPLTAIMGFADLLLRPTLHSDNRTDCIQTIRRNCDHVLTIVNDMLDLSKVEAGKMTVERIVCSPCDLVSQVVSLLRPRAIEKQLTLDVQYVGFCPATIRTDPTRLRQILMNLLGNAIKFTAQGGIRMEVELLTSDPERPTVQFRVIDTGIGMNPEQLKHLFEPFIQSDISSARRYGGTGLGLTISKHFAIMLGGDITVKTEAGRGSTFTVEIEIGSLRSVAMLERPTECGATGPGNDPIPLPNLKGRILLAEDGSDNQKLISSFLREAGAEVTIAGNGRMARDAISEAARARLPFDLALMDVQMPEMDGCAAASALRNLGFKMPMIALTAYALLGDRERCLTAGFNAFVTKPIDWGSLLKLVAGYLSAATAQSISRADRGVETNLEPLPN